MADLLIELLSEEIPARMQARAAQDLQRLVTGGLADAGLRYSSAAAFATPRRLTLALTDVPGESPATRKERKGPREDAPEQAIEGFLRSTGLTRGQLELRDTGKARVHFAVIVKPGRPAAEIVAEVLENTILNFPWPRSMRWGAGKLKWVRPLHSVLCVLSDGSGSNVVPFAIGGIAASDRTFGHRFMAPASFSVTGFDDYAEALKRAYVVVDPQDRRDRIWHDARNLAVAQGLEIVEDPGLLAEVAGLVEWPVVLMGEIGAEFLDLPPEVLQTSMREHQKFFSVRDPGTGRIERFITVANRETADNGATILKGNQKVLAARLSDARFFWQNDLRVAEAGMGAWMKALDEVTFHARLGTQGARIGRIAHLSRGLSDATGADADEAGAAALIAKADLASEMVYEFPELQGIMGRYYAHAAGSSAAIAAAAEEHWGPLGPSDAVPSAPLSTAVALADKIDTLTGFWTIDERPTGSKDPFALRRAALGVIRTVLDNGLRLRLVRPFETGLLQHMIALLGPEGGDAAGVLAETLTEINQPGGFAAAFAAVRDRKGIRPEPGTTLAQAAQDLAGKSSDLLAFFHDRLKVFLREGGIRHDVIDACTAMPGSDDLTLLVRRAEALEDFLSSDAGENLVLGFKRANNILEQAEAADGVEYSFGADRKFAQAAEEHALFEALETAKPAIATNLASEDFAAVMTTLSGLRRPIDGFLDAVQVNADNAVMRRNRLNLLAEIRSTCRQVADLTRIEA